MNSDLSLLQKVVDAEAWVGIALLFRDGEAFHNDVLADVIDLLKFVLTSENLIWLIWKHVARPDSILAVLRRQHFLRPF